MGKGTENRIVPIVSEKSTFSELTKFLVYSYFEEDHELVDKILVNREKGLIDEIAKLRGKCDFLEKEKNGVEKRLDFEVKNAQNEFEKMLKFELEKEKNGFEKRLHLELENEKKGFEKKLHLELEKEKNGFEKKLSFELEKEKNGFEKRLDFELKNAKNGFEKRLNLELEKEKNEFEKKLTFKLEKERDWFKKRSNFELEEVRESEIMMKKKLSLVVKEKLKVEEVFEKYRSEVEEKLRGGSDVLEKVGNGFEKRLNLELEKVRENYEKELKIEKDLMEKKLFLVNLEKLKVEDEFEKYRRDVEERLRILAKPDVIEKSLTLDEGESNESYGMMLKRERDMMENKLSLALFEKLKVEDEFERYRRELGDKIKILERENEEMKREIELHKEGDHEQVRKIRANLEKGLIDEADSRQRESEDRVDISERENGELREIELHKESDHEQVEKIIANREKGLMDEAERGRGEFEDKVGISKSENGELKREIELHEERLCKRIKLEGKEVYQLKGDNGVVDEIVTGFSSPDPSSIYCSAKSRNPESHRSARNLEFGQSKIHSEICLDKYEVFGSEQSSKTFAEVDNKCSEARTIGVRSRESRRGKGTSWKTPPDMIYTLRNDPEFCLSAVCALYRQHISAGKSTDNIGFRFCDIASGTEAAKYLINDDPTNNLSRSVSEVEQDRPSTLETCWKLAIKYLKQLFDMYQKKLDPLFCQEA